MELIQGQGGCDFNLDADLEMTNSSFDRASFRAKRASCCYRRHDVRIVRSERSSRQEESDMIDPRLEPKFGFDFLDQNRLDSVEFDFKS